APADALRRFAAGDRVVLVGTQMVAKGHHFPGVELAAVVDADTGLAMPDFRAEERTFQLLTQLAGRSGRDAPGRVLVQTFQPDSRPISYAARHDVQRFLAEELERRRDLGYPPFRHLVRIVVTGSDPDLAARALEEVRAGLPNADVLGPAPLLRLRGRHRAQLVVKTDRPRAVAAHLERLEEAYAERATDWHAVAERWDFGDVNDLIERHNRWYPVESRLAMDPRSRDFVKVGGRPYQREPLDAAWVLARFPA